MIQDTDWLPSDKLDLVGWGPDTCQKKDEEQYCWSPSAIPETVLTTANELKVSEDPGTFYLVTKHSGRSQALGRSLRRERHT